MSKTGRNDPCPCGSGRKFKKCCLAKEDPRVSPLESFVTPLAKCGDHPHAIDEVLDRFFDAMAERRFDDAEVVARELLQRFPDHIDGDERLGELYAARGDHLRSAEHFRRAAERMTPAKPDYDPAYVPFLLYRADVLERHELGTARTDLMERSDSISGDITRGDLADVEFGIADLSVRYPGHFTIDERRGQLAEVRRDFKAAAHHFRVAADRAAAQSGPEWHVGYLRRRATSLDLEASRAPRRHEPRTAEQ